MKKYKSSVFPFYIGTNAPEGNACLYKCEADFGQGTFSTVYTMEGPAKPSYLAGPAGNVLYTLGRPCGGNGAVYAFRETESPQTGTGGGEDPMPSAPLTPLGFLPCGGPNPCHISLDPQREFLLCANYGSGSVSLYALHEDGSIRSLCDWRQYCGTGFDSGDRQQGPHAHFAAFGPERDEVLVCDLGLDRVCVYELDRAAAKLRDTGRDIRLPDGSGPRHLTFSKQHPGLVYVITEMANTVFVFRYDQETDRYVQIQALSAVPRQESALSSPAGATSASAVPESAAAAGDARPPREDLMVPATADNGSIGCAIRFSADGAYLFVSSRLGYQSISAFRCGPDGSLTFCSSSLCGGITPRDFNVFSGDPFEDPSGSFSGGDKARTDRLTEDPGCDYLLVANQDSGLITALRFDRASEALTLLDMRMQADHPTCILPAPREADQTEDGPNDPKAGPAAGLPDAGADPCGQASDIYGGQRKNMEAILQLLLDRVEDLRLRYRASDSDPVEHCLGRIKSDASMREKCRRSGLPETARSALQELHDGIGVRIVCAFLNDVFMLRDYIAGFDDIEVVQEKDYIRRAKPNGYRSLHLIIRIRGYFAEIQLRTISMDTWAALEHHMKYKKDISGSNTALLVSELKRCADELASTDVSMQTLRDMIRGS